MKKLLIVAASVFMLSGCAVIANPRLSQMTIPEVEAHCQRINERSDLYPRIGQCIKDTLLQRDLLLIAQGRQPEAKAYYENLQKEHNEYEEKQRKEREEADRREKETAELIKRNNKINMCLRVADIAYIDVYRKAIERGDYELMQKMKTRQFKENMIKSCIEK